MIEGGSFSCIFGVTQFEIIDIKRISGFTDRYKMQFNGCFTKEWPCVLEFTCLKC
jgi:hypothetical protein